MRVLLVGSDHVGCSAAGKQSAPTDSDIDEAMSGNICRCGTYVRVRDAIRQAAAS